MRYEMTLRSLTRLLHGGAHCQPPTRHRIQALLAALCCMILVACGGSNNSGHGDIPRGSVHQSNPNYALLRPGDSQNFEIRRYYFDNGEPSFEFVHRDFVISARSEGRSGIGDKPISDLHLSSPEACSPSLSGICDRWTVTNNDNTNTSRVGYFNGRFGSGYDNRATVAMFPSTPQVAPPVKHMAGGNGFSLALTTDGRVWSWGLNDNGQLGLGDTFDRSMPTLISTLSNIVDVDAGYSYALALDANGEVWAWGTNGSGTLGDGTDTGKSAPIKVPGLSNIKQIAAANTTAYALTNDGKVLGWGTTEWRWGAFSWPDRLFPVRAYKRVTRQPVPVPTWESGRFLEGIASISAGGSSSSQRGGDLVRTGFAALGIDGTLWLYGLHYKTLSDRNDNHLFFYSNIMPWDYDDGYLGLGEVSEARPAITQVAMGSGFYLALDTSGRVWTAGVSNDHNQLGRDTAHELGPAMIPGLDQVVQVAAGDKYGMALRRDGQVWVWGENARGINGSVGFGDGIFSASASETLELPPLPPGPLHALSGHLDSVGRIAAGYDHALALESDESCDTGTGGFGGRIYTWGNGQSGLRGDGTGFQQLGATPVMTLGDDSSCTGIIGDRLIIYKAGSATGSISSSVDGVDPMSGIDQSLICRGAICWQRVPTGTTVTLTATAGVGATPAGIQWQWDCTSFPGLATTSVQVNGLTHCKVNFDSGDALPVASFSATPEPAVINSNIVFDASTSTGNLIRYQWDFNNDGTFNATGQQVNFSYPAAGSYTVRLVVTDEQGNSNETSNIVHVVETPSDIALLTVVVVNDGIVRDAIGGITCGMGNNDCSEDVTIGSAIQLTPTPGENIQNVFWDGCDQDFGLEGCFIGNMSTDRTVTATFSTSPLP